MIESITYDIPLGVLKIINKLPQNIPVVMLMRHSVRHELPPDAPGNDIPLTKEGRTLAFKLGAQIGERLKSLHSSPILRCMETAEMIRDGAKLNLKVFPDRRLGDPGIFVLNAQKAWQNWQQLGNDGVMSKLVTGSEIMPGMAEPNKAARHLVHSMLDQVKDPGIHVFVTHDIVIAATVSHLLGRPYGPPKGPSYLEGAFFMLVDDKVRYLFRDVDNHMPGPIYDTVIDRE
ncbi:MAG: histidine phosphatase family protein [Nitrospinae bacterium CG11_big_fil_rev_8_21_14_0_20_45_15]|nr:MAG: histidine phosphatase family protein [Nitrospinae bacterium CG11_big_fil_rev_8_21_14_0_20_45_15]